MTNLIPFMYGQYEIRIIEDAEGNPWWVAKDVCDALGLSNPTKAIEFLDDDERSKLNLGRQGEVNIISESGLYGLIGNSRKEEAQPLKRWIRKDVLPTIRKTGSYSTPGNEPKSLTAKKTREAATMFRAMRSIAFTSGLKGNQAVLKANQATVKHLGVNCLEMLGQIHLIAEDQELHLTPSDIGKRLGNVTGQKVNKLLELIGFQVETRTHKNVLVWKPTEEGWGFAVLKDVGKAHSDGTPVQQVFWKESILGVLKEDLE